MEYARKLHSAAPRFEKPDLLIVMRVYFGEAAHDRRLERPDQRPAPDGSFRIINGLAPGAQACCSKSTNWGLPCATEFSTRSRRNTPPISSL